MTQRVVIGPVNPISRATRPTAAGLNGFCPRPPNTCLATTIAMNAPARQSHQGVSGLTFRARISPVTSALRLESVDFVFASTHQRYSKSAQNAMQ